MGRMSLPVWARFVGRDSYNSWKAAQFQARAAKLIAERVRDSVTDTGGALLGGAGEAAKDIASEGWGLAKRGLNLYDEKVAKPGAGLVEATGVNPVGALTQGADAATGLLGSLGKAAGVPGAGALSKGLYGGLGVSSGGGFDPARVKPGVIAGGPGAWRENRGSDGLTGVEQFGVDVAGDPLSYAGGYGKVAAKLPVVGKVAGPALTALEEAPGRAVGAAIDFAGKGYRGVAPGLAAESGVSQANRYAGDAANLANHLINLLDTGMDTREAVRQTRALIGAVRDPAKAAPELSWRARTAATDALAAAERSNPGISEYVVRGLDDAGQVTPNRAAAVQRVGERARAGFVQTAKEARALDRQARIEQGGDAAVRARAEGWADSMASAVGRPLSAVNRFVNTAILGTVGYPLTNIPEDMARAARVGTTGSIAAEEGQRLFRGIQSELPRGAALPTDIPRMVMESGERLGSRLVEGTGGFERPSKVQQLLGIPSGQTYIDLSNRATEGIRRKVWVDTFRKEYDAAKAGGADIVAAMDRAKDAANQTLQQNFAGYGPESRGARAAKSIFPFFGYESHRLQYLPRAIAENPQIGTTYMHERQGTDTGEIQVSPNLSVDPTKGGVLGILSRLDPNEYNPLETQTATTGLSGRIERGLQVLGGAGFYPNVAVNAAVAGQRLVQGEDVEAGSLIPNTLKTGLNLTQASNLIHPNPLGAAAQNLQDNPLFDTRFREYAINQQLAKQGIAPEEATPQQREEAAAAAGIISALTAQAQVMKYRPEGQRQFQEDRRQAALAAGVPEERIGQGNPLLAADENGQRYLTAEQSKAIYSQHPEFERWAQVGEPLRRKGARATNAETRDLYRALDTLTAQTEAALKPVYEQYAEGKISAKDFRQQRGDISARAAAAREAIKAQYPGALTTREARQAFYAETGREITQDHPLDEAARGYFDIQPQTGADGRPDMDSFTAQRKAYLDARSPEERDYITRRRENRFSDPRMNEIERAYQEQLDLMYEYLAIPKYTSAFGPVEKEDERAVDAALAQYRLLRQLHPNRSEGWAWAQIAQTNDRGAMLGRHVARLKNKERERFLRANPSLRIFFSDVAADDLGID